MVFEFTGRVKLKLPFLANSDKMLSFDIDIYGGYSLNKYTVSGHLKTVANNWIGGKVHCDTDSEPDVLLGRDTDGYAYVSINANDFFGVRVSNLLFGYKNFTATDLRASGWTLTTDNNTPNLADVVYVRQIRTDNLPTFNSGSTSRLDIPRLINGTYFDGTADIETAKWGKSRTVSVTGDVAGTTSMDGGSDVTLNLTLANGLTLSSAIELTTANLNSIVTPGFYRQNNELQATVALNYPTTKAGTLTVSQSDDIVQEYVTREDIGSNRYTRSRTGLTWSSWQKDITQLTLNETLTDIDDSKITSGVLSVNRIPGLDASKITTGILDILRIPSIPIAKVTGIVPIRQIPALDAAKITSGTLDIARIPDIPVAKLSGTVPVLQIPNLDADKITSGIFDILRIPSVPVAKITGILPIDQIPDIPVDKVTGVVPVAQIPALTTSKITSGVFDIDRIPNIPVAKITGLDLSVPDIDASKLHQVYWIFYVYPTSLLLK